MTEEAAAATEAAPEKKAHRPIPKEPKFSETSIVKMKADKDGKPLDGTKSYELTFKEAPPVSQFWSLTMYDEGYFFVANPLNRFTLSQRDNLSRNPDGSVDLFLQHENPGPAKQSNWLPAPEEICGDCSRKKMTKSSIVLNGLYALTNL